MRSHRADFVTRGAPAVHHLVVEAAQPGLVDHVKLLLAVVDFVDLHLRELVDEVVDVDEAAANLDEDGLLPVLALGSHLDEDASLAELVDALRHSDWQDLETAAVHLREVFRKCLIDIIIFPANIDLVLGDFSFLPGGLALEREELHPVLGLLELSRQLPLDRG